MTLKNKKLDEITEQDLQSFIDNEVSEKQTLDYKQTINDVFADRENKKEFILDIISFANSSGGNIYYGIKEDKAKPVEICGIDIDNEDNLKLKIHNLLKDSIEPTIHGIDIKAVPLSNSKHVLIIKIPNSWAKPHRYKNTVQYTARNSAGKYPLDIHGLKQLFFMSETLAEQVRDFRAKRIADILTGNTPIMINTNNVLFVSHIIPISTFYDSFEKFERFDLKSLETKYLSNKPLIERDLSFHNYKYNFDGIVYGGTGAGCFPYMQIFRNGAIESCDDSLNFRNQNTGKYEKLYYPEDELYIINSLTKQLQLLNELEIKGPYIIMLSIFNAKDFKILIDFRFSTISRENKINELILPDVLLENAENIDTNLPKVMKPIFDTIWQACGYSGSKNYDAKTNYWAGLK